MSLFIPFIAADIKDLTWRSELLSNPIEQQRCRPLEGLQQELPGVGGRTYPPGGRRLDLATLCLHCYKVRQC